MHGKKKRAQERKGKGRFFGRNVTVRPRKILTGMQRGSVKGGELGNWGGKKIKLTPGIEKQDRGSKKKSPRRTPPENG